MSEMLSVRDLWSLQVMLTCLLHLYLSETFRCSAIHHVVGRLSVLMLSAGSISGYILYPYITYIYTHTPCSCSGFCCQPIVWGLYTELRWKPSNLNTALMATGLCFWFFLEFFGFLLFFWTAVWFIFSLFSTSFGLAWCFVTRYKHSSLPCGLGLWLSTTDRAPSLLFEEILH